MRCKLSSRALASCAIALLASCAFDLDVPTAQVGSVKGVVASKGAPLASVTVHLQPQTGDGVDVVTGTDGSFREDNLSAGLWIATVSPTGFIAVDKAFTVTNGAIRDLGTLTLFSSTPDVETAGTIRGAVRVQGVDTAQVQGATIEVLEVNSPIATAALGAAGIFTVQVPPGTYTVRATHPYFTVATVPNVTVQSKQESLLADNALVMQVNPGRLTGRVMKEVDGSPARVPAANVIVTADNGSSAMSATDGTFDLGGLPGGTRRLHFGVTGLHQQGPDLLKVVTPGMTDALGDVAMLLDRGDVVGTVEMGDASPLRDVTVFLDGTSYSAQVAPGTVDPTKGSFRIAGVPVGTYSLTAIRTGYRSVTSGVFTVVVDGAVTVPALARLVRVSGDFVIDDGDSTNTPGFTKRRDVLLILNNATNVADFRAAETDPVAAMVPFQAFGADGGTAIAFQLSAGEGEKTVFLQLRDSMMNLSPVLSATVVLDTTAPAMLTLTLAGGTGFTNAANPIPFTLVGNDPTPPGVATAGLRWARLSLTATVDASGQLTGPRRDYLRDDSFDRASNSEGPVTVHAQLIDNAGNASAVTLRTVVVDTTQPSGTLAIAQGPDATKAGFTNTPLTTLQLSANAEANGGLVYIRLANRAADVDTASPVPVSAGVAWFLDPLGDGTKTVHYRFIDSAGNLSPISSQTIVLDRAAPVPLSPSLTLVSLGTPALTSSTTGNLTATVSDTQELSPTQAVLLDVGGTASMLPPTSPTTVTGSIPFTLPTSDGVYAVRARFKDAAGNITSPVDFAVTLDRTPPSGSIRLTGTLASGAASTSLSATSQVRIDVTQSGATGIHVTASPLGACPAAAGSYVPLSDPSLLAFATGTPNGTATVRSCLRDDAGNTAMLAPVSITIDTQAPAMCQVQLQGFRRGGGNAPAGKTATRDVVASFSGCSETPADVYLVSTAMAPTCSASASLPWLGFASSTAVVLAEGDGLQTVRGCVRDAAGNVASVTFGTITLDTAPPQSPLLALNGGVAFVNRGQVAPGATFSAAVNASATGAVEWSFGETLATMSAFAMLPAMPSSFGFTNAQDGARTLLVRFRDDVGNDTELVSATVTFDLSAPTGTFSAVGTLADGTSSTVLSVSQTVRVDVVQVGATHVFVTAGALASCPVSAGAYVPLGDASLAAFNTGVSAGPVTVRGCVRDAAGNTTLMTPVSLTIDGAAPSGCALQLSGTKTDGSPAPAGVTASASVTASLSSCNETVVEIYTLESGVAPSCTAMASFPWVPLAALSPLALSPIDGSRSVQGCVRDAARNVGPLAPAVMNVDTTRPAGVAVTINGGAPFISAAQVSAGSHSASLSGVASGATEWAVGTTPSPSNFLALAGNNPRTFSVSIPGDGPITLYARFRDAVGNEAIASDDIQADVTAPPVPGVSVRPTGDVGFVNSEVVTVQLSAVSGAVTVLLSQGLSPAACTAALSSAAPQPPASAHTFVLSPSDGLTFVCARTLDAAGNPSPDSTTSVTLDRLPPTRPAIVTADSYLPLADGAGAPVDIASPASDTNLKGYERLGGTASSWTAISPAGPATHFLLPVVNDGSEMGLRNELRLRAVDRAGNASPESIVLITADTNAPEPAIVDARWVDNANRQGTVYWLAPDAGDLAHYEVGYDNAAQPVLSGTYAAEGISPLLVSATGATMSATLSGLINESKTYVRVVPVDRAGNKAPADAGFLELQPNELSPNLIATVPLAPATHAWAIEQSGGYLYVGTSQNAFNSCASLGDARLQVFDVRRLVAPIQAGKIYNPPPLAPTATFVHPSSIHCNGLSGQLMDIRIDPPWLFHAYANFIRIYSLNDPAVPVLKTTVTLPAVLTKPQLDVVGDTLIVSGQANQAYALSLATLYDSAVGTAPSYPASEEGNVDGGVFNLGGAFVTRDVLVQQDVGSQMCATRLTDAVDDNAGTPWNLADQLFPRTFLSIGVQPASRPLVSGNLAYFPHFTSDFTAVDITSIWTGTPPAAAAVTRMFGVASAQRFSLEGTELFVAEPGARGLSAFDTADLADPRPVTSFELGSPNTTHVVVFGNYAAILGNTLGGTMSPPVLYIVELASPRSFNIEASLASTGQGFPEVRPGFLLVTGWPTVYDLHTGSSPSTLNETGVVNHCLSGSATFEDTHVHATGAQLRVVDLDALIDRNATTGLPAGSNYFTANHPLGAVITDVAPWGNYLVAAETRVNGQQLWVEVYDARRLRDRNSATQLSIATSLASLQVFTAPSQQAARQATVTMSEGFAVLTFEDNPMSTTSSGSVFVVDLRPVFDDDGSTTLGASHIQAAFAMPNAPDGGAVLPRVAELSVDTLYVAGSRGLWAFPAAAVRDLDAGSVTDGSGATYAMVDHSFDDLEVWGSSIIAAPGDSVGNQALIAFDTAESPLVLKATGSLQLPPPSNGQNSCIMPVDGTSRKLRGGVSVRGSRAYVRSPRQFGKLQIIKLE